MFEKKNLKIIVIICFSFFSFFNVMSMESSDFNNVEGIKQNLGKEEIKNLEIEKNKNVISLPKLAFDVNKNKEEKKQDEIFEKADEKELKKLYDLYKKFCDSAKNFDINYGYEGFNLAGNDKKKSKEKIENNEENKELIFKKIEKQKLDVDSFLESLRKSFEKLKKFIEAMENKELLNIFFTKVCLKSEKSTDCVDDRYKKYLKLLERVDDSEKTLNSNIVFLYLDNLFKSNNFNFEIDKTIEYLLFYAAKMFMDMKFVNLNKKTVDIINNEFLNLVEDLKEEEIKFLKTPYILEKIKIEFNVRNKTFEFLCRLDEIANFYIDIKRNKIKTEKDLKELYENFCYENKNFDRCYGLESMVLRHINETYSSCNMKINAQNLAENDLFYSNNGYNISATYDRLDGLFRKSDFACIAHPYNKIEEYEAMVLGSLDSLKESFEKLKKFIETTKNKELVDIFFDENLQKYKKTINEIDIKYKKYLKLTENRDENKRVLNSNALFIYYDNMREDNSCDIEKTTDYLLFYITKIFSNMRVMDLDENTNKTINNEFLNLIKYLKEEEIKSLNISSNLERLKKEIFIRERAFNFIFKMGKIAEFFAEKQIVSLHHKRGSLLFRVKQMMSSPENPFGDYVQKIMDRNLKYKK